MNSFGIDCLDPTLLRGLIDIVLSKEEARDFKLCVPDFISEHHTTYNVLLKKVEDSVRELCSDYSIEIFGWRDGSTAREPVSITHQVQDAQLFIEKNKILTAENILYRSCLALADSDSLAADGRGYLQNKDGLTYWENKPLLCWHEEPLLSWHEPTSKSNTPTEIPGEKETKKITELTRQELRKQETQNVYARWQKAYVQLKQENPAKPDTWIADKISRLEIGKNHRVDTIRKNMKRK